MFKQIPMHEIICRKYRGGKRPLWNATVNGIRCVGAGNTADNAIRDFQKQYRAYWNYREMIQAIKETPKLDNRIKSLIEEGSSHLNNVS